MLDKDNTIHQLQSKTVQNSLKLIVINVALVITALTGYAFDVVWLQEMMSTWMPIAFGVLNTFFGKKVMDGRLEATSQIAPIPWKAAVKKTIKKE